MILAAAESAAEKTSCPCLALYGFLLVAVIILFFIGLAVSEWRKK